MALRADIEGRGESPDARGNWRTMNFYRELPSWWPLFSAPADYEEEAAIYLDLLRRAAQLEARSLLELGCGGGNNASFMKRELEQLTLTDVAPGMLDVSRALNPECEHEVGDMRHLRLGRQFDLVFVHDAISHLTSIEDVGLAAETAWVHTRPGGAALFAPDFTAETFVPCTETGGHDGEDGRALRYLSWATDPDPNDGAYQVDYAFLLRMADGRVRFVAERHVEGLFPRREWLRVIGGVGFEVRVVPLEHSEVEGGRHEMFVASRPVASR